VSSVTRAAVQSLPPMGLCMTAAQSVIAATVASAARGTSIGAGPASKPALSQAAAAVPDENKSKTTFTRRSCPSPGPDTFCAKTAVISQSPRDPRRAGAADGGRSRRLVAALPATALIRTAPRGGRVGEALAGKCFVCLPIAVVAMEFQRQHRDFTRHSPDSQSWRPP
jgi:hypothetical protein